MKKYLAFILLILLSFQVYAAVNMEVDPNSLYCKINGNCTLNILSANNVTTSVLCLTGDKCYTSIPVGGGGGGGDKWLDNGSYVMPNSTYASNVVVNGYINATTDKGFILLNPSSVGQIMQIYYKGQAQAMQIVNNGTGGSNNALNLVSYNRDDTTLGINGRELSHSTLKVAHYNDTPGDDSGAAAFGAFALGKTTGTKLYYGNLGNTTGSYLFVTNGSTTVFDGRADGRVIITTDNSQGFMVQKNDGTDYFRTQPNGLTYLKKIIPLSNGVYDIGDSSAIFDEIWFKSLNSTSPIKSGVILNMTSNNITSIGSLVAVDGSKITFGSATGITETDTAINIFNNQQLATGTPVFLVESNNGGVGKVHILIVKGKNNSVRLLGNSWAVMPENVAAQYSANATNITNIYSLYNFYNVTPFFAADTGGYGATFFAHGGADIWRELRVGFRGTDNGLLVQGYTVHNMVGNEFLIRNGSLLITKNRNQEVGHIVGESETILSVGFSTGTLSPFRQITTTGANQWSAVSDANCHSGFCANVAGGAAGAFRIMETNFSTANLANLNISFYLTTLNLLTTSNFSVYLNNGTNSFKVWNITDGDDVTDELIFNNIPASFNNQSNVGLRFYFRALATIRESFVDNIKVEGTYTSDTLANNTFRDGKISFGDGTCQIFLNGTDTSGKQNLTIGGTNCDISFIGNTTFTQVQSTNATGNIEAENIFSRNDINASGRICANGICLDTVDTNESTQVYNHSLLLYNQSRSISNLNDSLARKVNVTGSDMYGNLTFKVLSGLHDVRFIDTISSSSMFIDLDGNGRVFFRNATDGTLMTVDNDNVTIKNPKSANWLNVTLNADQIYNLNKTTVDTNDTTQVYNHSLLLFNNTRSISNLNDSLQSKLNTSTNGKIYGFLNVSKYVNTSNVTARSGLVLVDASGDKAHIKAGGMASDLTFKWFTEYPIATSYVTISSTGQLSSIIPVTINSFETFAVPVGGSIVADSQTDTFTFRNDSYIRIVSKPSTDTLTFNWSEVKGNDTIARNIETVEHNISQIWNFTASLLADTFTSQYGINITDGDLDLNHNNITYVDTMNSSKILGERINITGDGTRAPAVFFNPDTNPQAPAALFKTGVAEFFMGTDASGLFGAIVGNDIFFATPSNLQYVAVSDLLSQTFIVGTTIIEQGAKTSTGNEARTGKLSVTQSITSAQHINATKFMNTETFTGNNVNITGTVKPDNDCGIVGDAQTFERGTAVSNGFWALGNGASSQGSPQSCNGTITSIVGYCGVVGASHNASVFVNNVRTTCYVDFVASANTANSTTCSVTFNKNDIVGFKSETVSGSWTGCIGNIYMRYE